MSRIARIVLLLIGCLFAIQVYRAATVHLNADEALHYQLAHQGGVREAYLANNTNAHPPLLIMSLHFWRKAASAEWFLRLIPLLAYCAMIWFSFGWASLAFNEEAGLCLAALLAFAPPVYTLATELRHYMLALCWSMGALHFFERAVAARVCPPMWLGTGCLLLAILSHYSVLWFAAGYGVYTLLRLWREAFPRPLLWHWAAGQALAALTYGVLYWTHVRDLRGGEMARGVQDSWLREFYCDGCDSPLGYLWTNTLGLFQFLFASNAPALAAAALVIWGVVLLARRRSLLLAGMGTTFVIWMLAATQGLYPYGGTRHSVILLLWIAPPIAALAGHYLRGRMMVLALVVAGFVLRMHAGAQAERREMPREEQTRAFAVDATAYLRSKVPPRGLVFVDYQSAVLACYYLDRDKVCRNGSGDGLWDYNLGSVRLAVSRKWSLDPSEFVAELQILKRQFVLPRGAEVWVFDGGWGSPVNRMLEAQYAGTRLPELKEFGEHFGVFRIPN